MKRLAVLLWLAPAGLAWGITQSPPPIPMPEGPKTPTPIVAPGLPKLPDIPKKAAPAKSDFAPAGKPAPTAKPASTSADGFIQRAPLPDESPGNGAGKEGEPLKDFNQMRETDLGGGAAAPAEPPSALRTLLGVLTAGYMLAMLGLLLSGVIVFALARWLLRRQVVQEDGSSETEFEHVAESLAHEAADLPRYGPLARLDPAEVELHQRLMAAVPELSVHPKMAVAQLVLPSDPTVKTASADFVVLRRDGVVVAVVVVDPVGTPATERDQLVATLQGAGYRVLRCSTVNLPDVQGLRTKLLLPDVPGEPQAMPPPPSAPAASGSPA